MVEDETPPDAGSGSRGIPDNLPRDVDATQDRSDFAIEESRTGSVSGWVRPDRKVDPDHIHRYCQFVPRKGDDGTRGDETNTPGVNTEPEVPSELPLFFAFGQPGSLWRRVGWLFALPLRYSPTTVLFIAASLVIFSQFGPGPLEPLTAFTPIEAYLENPTRNLWVLVSSLAVIWIGILLSFGYLISTGAEAAGDGRDAPDMDGTSLQARLLSPDVDRLRDIAQVVVFYTGFLILLLGTVASVYAVTVAPDSVVESPNVVYTSGFLLLLYLGGPLVYDGMLRTDNLFRTLTEQDLMFEENDRRKDHYTQLFWEPLKSTLRLSRPVPPSLLISVLFVMQFWLVWRLTRGPFNTGSIAPFAASIGVNLMIVAITVQFIVLILYLYPLFQGTHEDNERDAPESVEDIHLHYRPGAPDNAGGFRDFGRFATRVNALLLLSGLYLVYRLYVQGTRNPLSEADPLLWHVDYTLPVVVYIVVICLWFYLSFWNIHTKMRREKERYINRGTDRGEEIADVETLRVLGNAPEWPLNNQVLFTVLTLDVMSILLAMVSLFT